MDSSLDQASSTTDGQEARSDPGLFVGCRAGVYNITTRHLTCREGRDIARDYVHGWAANMVETRRYVNGHADIRLVRNSYVVRFQLAQD